MAISWPGEDFQLYYIEKIGTPNSAKQYSTYLRRLDRIANGLDRKIGHLKDRVHIIGWAENVPMSSFGVARNRGDSLSALKCYLDFCDVK